MLGIFTLALALSLTPLAAAQTFGWVGIVSPTTNGLWGVFFDSATDGWAVGDAGTILHYDGTSWSVFASPTTNNLRSVYMLSPTDGWAVGTGVILRFNGVNWQSVPLPSNSRSSFCLNGNCRNAYRFVYFLNDNDGWAVGGQSATAHWNGVQWTFIQNPVSKTQCPNTSGKLIPIELRGVFMGASNDVWVVGWFGTMMHWNGTAFSLVTTPLPFCDVPAVSYPLLNIDSVYLLTSTDGWAVGEPGIVLRWDGTVWTQIKTPTNGMTFREVQMLSHTNVWFAGGGPDTLGGPAFVNWNGSTFTVYGCQKGYECGEMRSIYMVTATNGWVVGQIQSDQPPTTAPMLHYVQIS